MMNFRELAEKAGMSKFYFQNGKESETMFIIGKDFVEKFGNLIVEKAKEEKK